MGRAGERLRAERVRRPWLDHLLRAGKLYGHENGNHLAAAITYFSVLAVFPLLLVAMSVLGFVLAGDEQRMEDIQKSIADNVPGTLSSLVSNAVNAAANNAGGILSIGLLGALYSGLGWIGNLRAAVQAMWGQPKPKEKFLTAKSRDLLALVGLGLALAVSLALTSAGTALTGTLIDAAGLEGTPGVGTVTRLLGIVVAVAADVLIFAWMLARLPHRKIAIGPVLGGAVFAAVGFELLKVFGTYYLKQVTQSETAGIFGSVIGLLVWANLVSRFLLFATAWAASAKGQRMATAPPDLPGPPARPIRGRQPAAERRAGGGAVVAAGLVGMASGVVLAEATRPRNGRTKQPRS